MAHENNCISQLISALLVEKLGKKRLVKNCLEVVGGDFMVLVFNMKSPVFRRRRSVCEGIIFGIESLLFQALPGTWLGLAT